MPTLAQDPLFHGPDDPCLLMYPQFEGQVGRGTVIVCPGGNYEFLSPLEGLPVVRWLAEQGIGRGKQPLTWTFNRLLRGSGGSWHTTYTSIPHYVTSKARSVHLTDFSYGEFDFTDDESVSIAYVPSPRAPGVTDPRAPTMTGEIIGARTVARAVAAYTEYAGRQKPLPRWAREGGVILGVTGGAERVKRVLEKMRAWDVPVAGLWLQDWGGTRNTSCLLYTSPSPRDRG